MREAGSSPTRMKASPGRMPRDAREETFSLTSLRTCQAKAFPSRMRAAMGAGSLSPDIVDPCHLSQPLPRIKLRRVPAANSSQALENPMSAVPQVPAANDPDSLEAQEWLDA